MITCVRTQVVRRWRNCKCFDFNARGFGFDARRCCILILQHSTYFSLLSLLKEFTLCDCVDFSSMKCANICLSVSYFRDFFCLNFWFCSSGSVTPKQLEIGTCSFSRMLSQVMVNSQLRETFLKQTKFRLRSKNCQRDYVTELYVL